ncbi:MAG: rhodanese-like domain-containing protein [Planctomycetota bacterium]
MFGALSVIAILLALKAQGESSGGTTQEDAERDARRRIENLREEFERELSTLRRLLAAVAAGHKLDPEQIEEGRLWGDLTPDKAKALVEAGEVDLLDVRTPQETAGGIIPGAQLIPVDQLEERVKEVRRSGKPLLVYCAGGGRSAAACEFLSSEGQPSLHNLSGGIGSWSGPVVRPTE